MSDPASEPVASQSSDQPVAQQSQPPAPTSLPVTEFHIGDEFGTAKRNLPPAGIVAIGIVAVAVIVGIFAFRERPKPQGAGSIDFVAAQSDSLRIGTRVVVAISMATTSC